jgi:post-segregation antitoxin (ccd killing protein)
VIDLQDKPRISKTRIAAVVTRIEMTQETHPALKLADELRQYRTQRVDNAAAKLEQQHALIVQMAEVIDSALQAAGFEKHAPRPWHIDGRLARAEAAQYLKEKP